MLTFLDYIKIIFGSFLISFFLMLFGFNFFIIFFVSLFLLYIFKVSVIRNELKTEAKRNILFNKYYDDLVDDEKNKN